MTSARDRSAVSTGEKSLGVRYRLLLLLAALVVFWERLWRSFWKPCLVAFGFIAIVLLVALPELPGLLHLAVLIGFAGLFGWLFYTAVRRFQAVDLSTARRRLEQDSGLANRPLSGLVDQPVSTHDSLSLKIWLAHVQALRDQVDRLTLRPPAPGLANRDPFALRVIVLLALVIGVAAGYDDAGPRLARALTIGGNNDGRFSVEVWLTPLAYTHRSPVFLGNDSGGAIVSDRIEVPEGSVLTARVAGHRAWYAGDPILEIGDRSLAFTAIGTARGERESFQVETTLDHESDGSGLLEVRANGSIIASWRLDVVPDSPPTAKFVAPPEHLERYRLGLSFQALDDYAVDDLELEMRQQNKDLLAGDRILTHRLPVGGAPSRRQKIDRKSNHDLTAHPWAGLAVEMRLVARDGAGQEGASDWIDLDLPERNFTNPVARAIIAQRRRLALLEPGSRIKIEQDVIVGLDMIKEKPEAYESDLVVFLSLSIAQARLTHSLNDDRYESVMELLWNTAIRLEDGGVGVAERELEQARDELRDALAENADPDQIERLMDRVSEALDAYLQALARKMQAEGGEGRDIDSLMRMLGANDLQDILNKARELARTGAADAAQEMLSELDRILGSIQGALLGGPASAAMNEMMKQFGEMLDRLQKLTESQQNLLDDTFARQRNKARNTPDQSAAAAELQRALRRELGQLMLESDRLFGSILPSFGQADRQMRAAADSLAQGLLPEAQERQVEVGAALRQAAEDISSQMARMMAGAFGLSLGGGKGGPTPGGQDPFGRMTGQGGIMPGGTVGIPDRGQVHRSRQILDELRRRAGQHKRPRSERDYIDRLLKNF